MPATAIGLVQPVLFAPRKPLNKVRAGLTWGREMSGAATNATAKRLATSSEATRARVRFGLRRQLLVLATVFLAIPLTTALLLRCVTYVRALEQHEQLRRQEQARECRERLKQHLLLRLESLVDLAASLSTDRKCCEGQQLKEIAARHSEWESLSLADAAGVIRASTNPSAVGHPVPGIDPAERAPAAARFVGAPVRFTAAEEYVVPLMTRLGGDSRAPLLVASLKLKDLQRVVEGTTRYTPSGHPEQFAVLLDSRRRMLAAPPFMGPHSARLQRVPDSVFEGFFPGAVVSGSGASKEGLSATAYRVTRAATERPAPNWGLESDRWLDPYWGETILYLFDASNRAAAMKRALIGSTAALVVIVLLGALLVAYLSVRRLTRQLDPLMEATERLTEGSEAPVVPVITEDELGQLAKSFNRMSRALAEKEKLLRERSSKLEASNARLRELDALKTKLLSTVSHELRTPITAILASAKIIGRFHDEKPEAVERFSGVIVREAERLGRLLDNLLDLAKIESGATTWRDTVVRPEDVVDAVAGAMEAWASEAAILIERRVDYGLPRLFVDRDRIAQVLTNLVHNAIKYSPQGGRVVVAACRAQHSVLFAVEDDGPGIPREDLQRVFDKFYRVEPAGIGNSATGRQAGGTGLGLAICREIVEHYGGRIWVESEPGKGSRFCFTVPAAAHAQTSVAASGGARDQRAGNDVAAALL